MYQNRATLIGFLGKDAEAKTSNAGRFIVPVKELANRVPARPVRRKIWQLLQSQRRHLTIGVTLVIVNQAAGLALPGSTKYVVDEVIGRNRLEMLPLAVGVVGLAAAIQGFTAFGLTNLLSKSARRIVADLRCDVQRHAMRLPMSFHDRYPSGNIVSSILTDVDSVRGLLDVAVSQLVSGLIRGVISASALVYISPTLGAAVLLILLPTAFFINGRVNQLQRIASRTRELRADVAGHLSAVCTSSDGRFVHDLIVPVVRKTAMESRPAFEINGEDSVLPQRRMTRTNPPGSKWLYVKIYGGSAILDDILVSDVLSLAEELKRRQLIVRWFFVRYSDPDYHLRLRYESANEEVSSEVFSIVTKTFAPLLRERLIWSVQLDTYEREIERYGGPEGMSASEDIFHADSDAVLSILLAIRAEDSDARWRAALVGVDRLFSDLKLDSRDRQHLCSRLTHYLQLEFGFDDRSRKWVANVYRTEGSELAAMLGEGTESSFASSSLKSLWSARSARIASAVEQLRLSATANRLKATLGDLATTYAHMHVNRVIPADQRLHEASIYDLLFRLYRRQVYTAVPN